MATSAYGKAAGQSVLGKREHDDTREDWTKEQWEADRRKRFQRMENANNGLEVKVGGGHKLFNVWEVNADDVVFHVPPKSEDGVAQPFFDIDGTLYPVLLRIGPMVLDGAHFTPPGRLTEKTKKINPWKYKYKTNYVPLAPAKPVQLAVPDWKERQEKTRAFFVRYNERYLEWARANPRVYASYRSAVETACEEAYKDLKGAEKAEKIKSMFVTKFATPFERTTELGNQARAELKDKEDVTDDRLLGDDMWALRADTNSIYEVKERQPVPQEVLDRLKADPTDEAALKVLEAYESKKAVKMPDWELQLSKKARLVEQAKAARAGRKVTGPAYFDARARNGDTAQGVVSLYNYCKADKAGSKLIQKKLITLVQATARATAKLEVPDDMLPDDYMAGGEDHYPELDGPRHDVATTLRELIEADGPTTRDAIGTAFTTIDDATMEGYLQEFVDAGYFCTDDDITYTLPAAAAADDNDDDADADAE